MRGSSHRAARLSDAWHTQLSPATKTTHLHNLSANLPAHGRLYQRRRQESTVIPQELQTLNTARPQLNPCHCEHTTRETTRNILSSTQADTLYPVTCCIAELSDRERALLFISTLCSSSSSSVSPTFHTASSFSLHRPFLLYCNPSIAPASGKFSTNAHSIPPPYIHPSSIQHLRHPHCARSNSPESIGSRIRSLPCKIYTTIIHTHTQPQLCVPKSSRSSPTHCSSSCWHTNSPRP